jgi:Zn-dependent M28 family amino/carboxypeptidase
MSAPKRRIRTAAVLACLILAACSHQPKAPPPSTEIDDVVFRDHLQTLSSDEFEGRRPGTHGEDKTIAYLTEQFRKVGLKPGNLKGGAKPDTPQSYQQVVPLIELIGSGQSLAVQGAKGMHRLELGADAILFSKRAQAEPAIKASELIFAGFGIVAPEYSWNDYQGIDVHGKTVLVLVSDPGPLSGDPKLFKGNAMSAYGRWEYKVEEAARQGASAILLIQDPAAQGFGWEQIKNAWGGVQYVSAVSNPELQPMLEGWVRTETARALFNDSGFDFSKLSASAARPGFRAVDMALKVDGSLHNAIRSFNSSNVIGILPGSGHKDEYILYNAHWDALGIDASIPGHNIFNGAVSNGSGIAGLLAMAQSFVRTDPKPERTIVFLATTAAEPDHLGAAYYLQNPVFPLAMTAAVINVDTLLFGGHTRDVSILGFGSSDLEDTARGMALLQGRESHPDPFPGLGQYYESDAYTYARAGIPALYVVSGIDNSARGPAFGTAQRQDYLAHHYRLPTDQYSPDLDVRGAVDDLAMYYEVGLRVARSRRFPRWYPNSEFRTLHHHSQEAVEE